MTTPLTELKGVPFVKYLESLTARRDYLVNAVVEDKMSDGVKGYFNQEIAALDWALIALTEQLTQPVDQQMMRRNWIEFKRRQSQLNQDLELFIKFLDWQDAEDLDD